MGPLFAAACGLSLLGQVLSLAIIVSSEGRPKGLESRVFLACMVLSTVVGLADVATGVAGVGRLPSAGDAESLTGLWVTSRVVAAVQPLRRAAMLVGTLAIARRALTRVIGGRRIVPNIPSRTALSIGALLLALFLADAIATGIQVVPGTHIQVLDGIALFRPDRTSVIVDTVCVLQATTLAAMAIAYKSYTAATPGILAAAGFAAGALLPIVGASRVAELQYRAAFGLLSPLLDVATLALLGLEVERREASGSKRVLAARRATAAALRVGL